MQQIIYFDMWLPRRWRVLLAFRRILCRRHAWQFRAAAGGQRAASLARVSRISFASPEGGIIRPWLMSALPPLMDGWMHGWWQISTLFVRRFGSGESDLKKVLEPFLHYWRNCPVNRWRKCPVLRWTRAGRMDQWSCFGSPFEFLSTRGVVKKLGGAGRKLWATRVNGVE